MIQSVLFVHHGQNWIRGSERAMLDLAAALPAHGWQSSIVCTADAVVDEARALGVPAERIAPWTRTGVLPGPADVAIWRARLRRLQPDVVHVNDSHFLPPVLASAMRAHLPLVVHQHILDDAFSRLYSLMHQASAIVTISAEAEAAVAGDGYPRERLHRIPNGVPLRESRDAVDIRELVRAAPGESVAVSVGSLIPRKGHDRTLNALRHALDLGATIQLAVVGSGDEEEALRELARALGVEARVHFLGERGDVQDLLRNADLFISASREEVQPLSVIEAMLCGLPVIASAIQAHVEMVDGDGGMIVEASDAAAFGVAIAGMSARRSDLHAARSRFSARAQERYSFTRYVERFAGLYQSLVQTPRREFGFLRGLRHVPAYTEWVASAVRRRVGGARERGPSLESALELPRSLARD
ncbi:MAG TPA: glycosyltransferase [Gemmatimonadaceae bacterium]|nr:glycosyltransferase [Gemmatimonadaceae bacterium]